MRIDITAHPAEDIVLDLAGVRELQAENARLSTDRATMQTHIRGLQAQLEEARKLPVALLPEITDDSLKECRAEWFKDEYGGSDGEQGRAATTVLRRHFREAAEARVKPQVDVEAVAREISRRWHSLTPPPLTIHEAACTVLREHVIDTPADETLAAALARVQRETRRECAAMVRECESLGLVRIKMLADRMERGL